MTRCLRRSPLGEAAALLVLGGVLFTACGESSDPVSISDPVSVTRSERVWIDTTRPTAPTGSYAGADTRTLRTLIWQPSTAGALPLFVMAHGFTGLPEKFDAIAARIAAAGVVVAAPAFPLTNGDAPGGDVLLRDVQNQPADVSFVIDRLLDANVAADDALHGRILTDAIAVLGHSLGGTTTIALTRKDCCRDPRVRASLLFAPGPIDVFAFFFGTDSITAGPPTMVLQGTADPIISSAASHTLYAQIDPPKVFVGITGADHSDAIEGRTEPLSSLQIVTERAIVAFLNDRFRGASRVFDDTVQTLAAEGNTIEHDDR